MRKKYKVKREGELKREQAYIDLSRIDFCVVVKKIQNEFQNPLNMFVDMLDHCISYFSHMVM